MKVELVNTLDDNRPQYRLGDAVLLRHTRCGERALELVASNQHLFAGTVLYEYARRINRSDPDPQWIVLKEVVSEMSRVIELEYPREDELVIHLRMGDWKGFKLSAETLVNYVVDLINRCNTPIRTITIVTAVHYGKFVLENRMSRDQVTAATSSDIEKVEKIIGLFSENGLKARLRSHREIDRDFCFLSNSRCLVLGNGHFSLCAAMVSSAEYFVPPWARSGASVNIDELLESRAV